jgi:hypothetical protein
MNAGAFVRVQIFDGEAPVVHAARDHDRARRHALAASEPEERARAECVKVLALAMGVARTRAWLSWAHADAPMRSADYSRRGAATSFAQAHA